MLTVICPNCRHRFPPPGCCSSVNQPSNPTTTTTTNINFEPMLNDNRQQQVTISTQYGIQSGGCLIQSSNAEVMLNSVDINRLELRSKLSGGGCLVQKTCPDEADQQRDVSRRPFIFDEEQLKRSFEQVEMFQRGHSTTARLESPPSGCQELPGTRREPMPNLTTEPATNPVATVPINTSSNECRCSATCRGCSSYCRSSKSINCSNSGDSINIANNEAGCRRSLSQTATNNLDNHLTRCCKGEEDKVPENIVCNKKAENSNYSGDVQIQVNATVRLPSTLGTNSTLGSCTLNITATTSTTSTCNTAPSVNFNAVNRIRNNFNGGGIINLQPNASSLSNSSNASSISNNRNEAPGTPVSWLACPWTYDADYSTEKDAARLVEVRKVLQTCGWYHEGLSWQQSESLLKDAPVGKWLMRDSSDPKYTFAISVQTTRGPTSIRVYFYNLKFRLDAEPRLASTMPKFDCPIKMVEYYCEYSKRMDEQRQEVWVDYSGQVYSQIYLAEPLIKAVRSLTHLARVAVNKNSKQLEKQKEKLPPLLKNYLKEYPYML